MTKKEMAIAIPDELVMSKILIIRGQKVMIDKDLSELYGVTTKVMNQQVKRNLKRFPEDFMFTLTQEEKDEVVTNCDHLQGLKYSPHLPFVFTEHGAIMLASILNSQRAIEVNIQIVRIFIKMREMLITHKELLLKVEQIEKRVGSQDEKVQLLFNYLNEFISEQEKPRKKIGYKIKGK